MTEAQWATTTVTDQPVTAKMDENLLAKAASMRPEAASIARPILRCARSITSGPCHRAGRPGSTTWFRSAGTATRRFTTTSGRYEPPTEPTPCAQYHGLARAPEQPSLYPPRSVHHGLARIGEKMPRRPASSMAAAQRFKIAAAPAAPRGAMRSVSSALSELQVTLRPIFELRKLATETREPAKAASWTQLGDQIFRGGGGGLAGEVAADVGEAFGAVSP